MSEPPGVFVAVTRIDPQRVIMEPPSIHDDASIGTAILFQPRNPWKRACQGYWASLVDSFRKRIF